MHSTEPCPDLDQTLRFLGGRLDRVERAQFEAHLAACGACAAYVGRLRDPRPAEPYPSRDRRSLRCGPCAWWLVSLAWPGEPDYAPRPDRWIEVFGPMRPGSPRIVLNRHTPDGVGVWRPIRRVRKPHRGRRTEGGGVVIEHAYGNGRANHDLLAGYCRIACGRCDQVNRVTVDLLLRLDA